MLTAPSYEETTFASFSAWDDFSGISGALSGDSLKVGGTWTTAGGDADDFQNDGNGRAVRTTTTDAGSIGTSNINRIARAASVTLAACVVQVDITAEYTSPGSDSYQAHLVARYVDTSNFFYVSFIFGLDPSQGWTNVRARKQIAGAEVEMDYGNSFGRPGTFATWTLRVLVNTAGRYFIWMYPQGTNPGKPLGSGFYPELATAGALDDGQTGFGDSAFAMSATGTRVYDNFAAWVPTANAVMYASQSCQLGTDGLFREDSTGTAWGPAPGQYGDIPRIPVAGVEARTTETFIKASRGDFAGGPDSGIDNISARPFYRPSWLYIP